VAAHANGTVLLKDGVPVQGTAAPVNSAYFQYHVNASTNVTIAVTTLSGDPGAS
jgi:hypothetical protein